MDTLPPSLRNHCFFSFQRNSWMQLRVNHQLQISAQWYSQVLINTADNDKQNFRFFSAIRTARNRLGFLTRKTLLGSLDFNISKLTDPKGSAQGYASPFEKLSNQGQSVWELSNLTMLGTTNQEQQRSHLGWFSKYIA